MQVAKIVMVINIHLLCYVNCFMLMSILATSIEDDNGAGGGTMCPHFFQMVISPQKKGPGGPKFRDFS